MRIALCLLITFVATSAVIAQDAKSPAPLPPAGSWVTYQVLQPDTANLGYDLFYTIRVLEEEQREGETCRWVEFDWAIATPDRRQRMVNRYLIPVKALRERQHPFLQLKAAFHGKIEQMGRNPDQTTGPLESFEEQPLTKEYLKSLDDDGWEMLLFPGLQRNTEESIVKAKVGYQRGTLSCHKEFKGVYKTVTRENVVGQIYDRVEEHMTYRITHHPRVPSGVAGAVFESEEVALDADGNRVSSGPGHPDMHWLLHDFGTDAKSAFKLKESEKPSDP